MTDYLAWTDVETTGVSPYADNPDKLLQVALVLTSVDNLRVPLAEIESVVKYSSEEIDHLYDLADPYVQKMHTNNGLWDELRDQNNPKALSLNAMDWYLRDLVESNTEENDNIYLAGNSIFLDREFINAYLPQFASTLHYRMIDVSTLQNFATWNFGVENYEKKLAHTALSDIKESITQYAYLTKKLSEPTTLVL